MTSTDKKTLLEAGVQYGHLACRWSPDFRPYLLMKENNRHIIDLDKTIKCLEEAGEEMKKILASGQKILFIARKKQAKGIVEKVAKKLNQPYVVAQRWLGGTATNFVTIKRLLKKLADLERQHEDPVYIHLTKKEKLIKERKKKKLESLLEGIVTLKRLPAAFFVLDVMKEITAVKEAKKLGIPVFAIFDSNSPSRYISYPIPGNDDLVSSIEVLMSYLEGKMEEGLKIWEEEKKKRFQGTEKKPATK